MFPVRLSAEEAVNSVGQKGGHACVRAGTGSRPFKVRDNRHDPAYISGAICPARGAGAAIVLLAADSEAMSGHLKALATPCRPRGCCRRRRRLGRRGSHRRGKRLKVPDSIRLLSLPFCSPRAEPGQESLGRPPPEQAVRPGHEHLRRHPRCMRRCVGLADRRPGADHLNRLPRVGVRRCLGGVI